MRKAPIDAVVAVAAYWAGWSLRFGLPRSDAFRSGLAIFGVIVVAQVLAVTLAGTYGARSIVGAFRRFIIGMATGSVAGASVIVITQGRGAISLAALGADVVILALGGLLWRCGEAAVRLNRRPTTIVDAPPHMAVIGGPTPILRSLSELFRYRTLVGGLVARDLKLKYRGSLLGFFWSLLNPLVMVALYTIVFTFLIPNQTPGFVIRLLVGLLAWGLFANSAQMSTGTVVDSGGLLKSVYLPRGILPLSTVLFNLSLYLLTLAVFVPVLFFYYGIVPSSAMLAFPVFLSLQVIFTIGVALALAATTAIFRDIKHLTEISLSMLFWLTPIIYPLAGVKSSIRVAILLSPMSSFVVAYQRMFYEQQWPAPYLWGLATFFACTSILVGATLFSSLEPRFGEQV